MYWWLQRAAQLNVLPIILSQQPKEPDVEIFVDASDAGWDVASSHIETAGYWKEQEKKNILINVRELKTIAFALQLHAREFEEALLNIFSDNITVLEYAKKSGEGKASPWLRELALEIQEIVVKYNLQVQCQHIQGIKNVKAQQLSRNKMPLYEWKLLRRFFEMVQETWDPLKLNAFATRANTRLPRFWSLNPDPQAEATNAWNQQWTKTGLYLHPPWKLVPKGLWKLKTDNVKKAVLITQNWPS